MPRGESIMVEYDMAYKELTYDHPKIANQSSYRQMLFRILILSIQIFMIIGVGIMTSGVIIAQTPGLQYAGIQEMNSNPIEFVFTGSFLLCVSLVIGSMAVIFITINYLGMEFN